MKQLEVKQTITYRWWKSDGSDIKKSHIEDLANSAEERIATMRLEGYISGDLHNTIINEDDTETEYTGWWESSIETPITSQRFNLDI